MNLFDIHLLFAIQIPILALLLPGTLVGAETRARKPNILVIIVDDLGYADLGCQGSREVVTPNIDSLASNGRPLTNGYVTAPQCSPSRAGLLTGLYQQRFGHEANPNREFLTTFGLPEGLPTLADRLREANYRTIGIGKWDQGARPASQPWTRGFERYFGFYTGSRSFFSLDDPNPTSYTRLRRGPNELVPETGYMTDVLTQAAVEAIELNKSNNFFLYLAYNAPHWPMEAKPHHLERFAHVRDLHRRTFLAMMASLDEGVGTVLAKLRDVGLDENTLIFFLSDNGGPTGKPRSSPDADFQYGQNTSLNSPLRGVKGELYEGGIRVPFLVQWKGTIKGSIPYDQPVSSLDIVPTALAAAGLDEVSPKGRPLDGINLLPYLTDSRRDSPHSILYWRWMGQLAARQGQWKLVKMRGTPFRLFDLSNDLGETKDLAASRPEIARSLEQSIWNWNAQLAEPLWRLPSEQETLRKAYARPQ